jgi:hypothetical protein
MSRPKADRRERRQPGCRTGTPASPWQSESPTRGASTPTAQPGHVSVVERDIDCGAGELERQGLDHLNRPKRRTRLAETFSVTNEPALAGAGQR